jgi:hypothetical protein
MLCRLATSWRPRHVAAGWWSPCRVPGDGDPDAGLDVLAEHGSYLHAIDRMFDAVDRGEAAEVLRIDGEEVDPRFAVIEEVMDQEAEEDHAEALRALADLESQGILHRQGHSRGLPAGTPPGRILLHGAPAGPAAAGCSARSGGA